MRYGFFVIALMAMATASASAQKTDTLGNLVVTQLPLASGETLCATFGGDNTDDLYLVTLQGAVSRAYKVDQNGLHPVTDSTITGAPLCIPGTTSLIAGQVGTVSGQTYVTILGPSAQPQSIVIGGVAVLQIGATLPGGTVVTSFRSQPVASDSPIVAVNESANGGILYRYDGNTWIEVPKPAGKWATYHVVGTGLQRDVYAEDGINTVVWFSNSSAVTLFNASHPPVAGNPISCCLTMSISPVDGTGIVSWGTGQNSYRTATFAPGQSSSIIAQAGTPPTPDAPLLSPLTLWPVNSAGGNVLFMGTSATSDLSTLNQQGEVSFIYDPQTTPINWSGFDSNSFQLVSGWGGPGGQGQIFLGAGRFVGFLPYGNRINSQLQGIFCASTQLVPELCMWGYMPRINSVWEDDNLQVTVQTNVVPNPSAYFNWYSYGGNIIRANLEATGIFTFQYPSIYRLGESPLQIQVCVGACADSPWVLFNFGTPTTPRIASISIDNSTIASGQSTNLNWSVVNATTVSFDQGIGAVSNPTGTIAVSPTATTTYALTACNPGGCSTASVTVTVIQPTPVPVISGIFSAAGITAQPLAPGALFSVYGTNLCGVVADSPVVAGVVATVIPLPVDVGRFRVLIDGEQVPLLFGMTWNLPDRPAQINGQLPANLDSTVSHGAVVQLRASSDDSLVATSDAFPFTVQAAAPTLFAALPTMQFIAQKWTDNSLVSASNPARPGDTLILYGTGFGAYDKAVQDGNNAAGLLPGFAYITTPVQAQVQTTVNGQGAWMTAPTLYCVASPQFVGVTQCAITIPASMQADASVTTANLQLTQGSASTGSLSFAFSPSQ